jgi:sec-independent protein translocase protein TatA
MTGLPLLFLDISGGEFIVIMLVAFFVFGPKKLPEIARKIGRTMNEIKNVSSEITREFKDETKNITSELRAARESARIDATSLSIDNVLSDDDGKNNQLPKRKNISDPKPPFDVSVSYDSNNNDDSLNVNPEKGSK